MDKLIAKIKQNKLIIGATVGATAALGILYFFLSKRKETVENAKQSTSETANESAYL